MLYSIIGAGITGSTVARQLAEAGESIVVYEKQKYIGGHASDDLVNGTCVSKFGPHIFHTSDEKIWEFVNRFSKWKQYRHIASSYTKAGWVPWPINKETIEKVFRNRDIGEETPWIPFPDDEDFQIKYHIERNDEAHRKFNEELNAVKNVSLTGSNDTFENRAIRSIGFTLYDYMIRDYTKLQWRMDPKDVPAEVFGRIRIKDNYSLDFFSDKYVALPSKGYSKFITSILSHKNILVITDANMSLETLKELSKSSKVISTAPVDEISDFIKGELEYLKVKFNKFEGKKALTIEEGLPAAVCNFSVDTSIYTRLTSYHKMYNTEYPIVVLEQPGEGEKLYPIRSDKNMLLYGEYKKFIQEENNIICCGRCGGYEYIDMDVAIQKALTLANDILK